MLNPIQDLPDGVTGVLAGGRVTKHDYQAVLRPMLEDAAASGEPLRLLYAFRDEFEGFTPEAAWEDANLAFEHLDDVERCAVVSDHAWVRKVSQIADALTPAHVRTFPCDDWDDAVSWLSDQEVDSISS
ncbi:MAG: STAS/SEC14 domain-containing protein [Longimicrobiales bacterium]|nr:STAS/SEC14 domain-containing protein [Longimicrobiales bacterium]